MTGTLRKALKFFGLCVVYTLALVLVVAAINAEHDPAGKVEINFAYKVF